MPAAHEELAVEGREGSSVQLCLAGSQSRRLTDLAPTDSASISIDRALSLQLSTAVRTVLDAFSSFLCKLSCIRSPPHHSMRPGLRGQIQSISARFNRDWLHLHIASSLFACVRLSCI